MWLRRADPDLAGAMSLAGNETLLPHAAWKRLSLRNGMGEGSVPGLSRTPVPYHPGTGERTQVEANLFLRPDNPGPGLCRQDHHASHACDQFRRVCAKGCDRPDPGEAILAAGVLFNGAWIIFALVTYYSDKISHPAGRVSMG